MWQYNYFEQTELYHYGVPGMKWGHRKQRDVQGVGRVRSAGAAKSGSGSSGSSGTKNAPKTREQAKNDAVNRRERGKKIAAGVLVGIGVAGVATAAVVAARKKGIQKQIKLIDEHNAWENWHANNVKAAGQHYEPRYLEYPKSAYSISQRIRRGI